MFTVRTIFSVVVKPTFLPQKRVEIAWKRKEEENDCDLRKKREEKLEFNLIFNGANKTIAKNYKNSN